MAAGETGDHAWSFDRPIDCLSLYLVVYGGWGDWGPWSSDCPTDCLSLYLVVDGGWGDWGPWPSDCPTDCLSLYLVVDGGWGDWGPWSFDCPTNCLQERKRWRIRTRTCTDPAPQGDGNDCRGDKIEQDTCSKDINYSVLVSFGVIVLLLTIHIIERDQ